MSLELIEANSEAGFNFPYYFNIPDSTMQSKQSSLLVEPTHMPGPSDDFQAYLDEAKRRASSGFTRRIADQLAVPLLHPVFPRPVYDRTSAKRNVSYTSWLFRH
jgi:hypothetical protein